MTVSSVLTLLVVVVYQPTAAAAVVSPANVSLMTRCTTVNITTAMTAVTKTRLVREVRQL